MISCRLSIHFAKYRSSHSNVFYRAALLKSCSNVAGALFPWGNSPWIFSCYIKFSEQLLTRRAASEFKGNSHGFYHSHLYVGTGGERKQPILKIRFFVAECYSHIAGYAFKNGATYSIDSISNRYNSSYPPVHYFSPPIFLD